MIKALKVKTALFAGYNVAVRGSGGDPTLTASFTHNSPLPGINLMALCNY